MRVLNFGSLNIDYVYRMAHLIQPGETAACRSLTVGCGGKGLNQSIALARAGLETYHAGLIGAEGGFLTEKLREKGVNTRWVRQVQGSSGHAIIQVDDAGQNCIILSPGANVQLTRDYIDQVLEQFSPGDILLLQNETNEIPYLIEQGAAHGLQVALNAAPMTAAVAAYPLEKLRWLLVNEVEGGALAETEDPEQIARRLAERFPHTAIVLTLGAAGCLYRRGDERCFVPARRVQAVDTTAAGDTFTGFFLRGAAQGLSPQASLELATAASALAVMRPGAADSVPDYEEVCKTVK